MKITRLHSSSPFPLGASCSREGDAYTWNFSIYSKNELSCLILQDIGRLKPAHILPLDKEHHHTGGIWHTKVVTSEPSLLWAWGKQEHGRIRTIQDPYAKLIDSKNTWGENQWHRSIGPEPFPLGIAIDWEEQYKRIRTSSHTQHTQEKSKDPLIIYEMHIRGFTKDPSSKVRFPGTFRGAIEKLPHLQRLGITAIELLPITEFDETEWKTHNPVTGEPLYNYWGYSPLNFFSPCGRYFSSEDPLQWPHELQEFVDACHAHNIQVILDVVFNHTGEGNELGPSYSWKELDPDCYYIRNPSTGEYYNYSGCGNTINANHPIVADMILHALRHWVLAYNIDGFRFDLASCLTRSQTGAPMSDPAILERIALDPILSHCILIAEPWDAAGLYQTGALHSMNQKGTSSYLEWNDKFRDDIRRFIKGTKGFSGVFATRLSGSQDIYGSAQSPQISINYITSHDGFSLHDLVSYNSKHNIENGEHNNDGMSENHSWNCGHEGETKDSSCIALRGRQMENFMTALFMAQGTPMMLMGDEYGHTKRGNNNAWCQDSPLNWFQWNKVDHPLSLTSFIAHLIQLRSQTQLFQRENFLTPSDVEWHGKKPYSPDWSNDSAFVAATLMNPEGFPSMYMAFSMEAHDVQVEIPPLPQGMSWHIVINTGAIRPNTFFRYNEAPKLSSHIIKLHARSTLVLVCKRTY